MTQENLVIDEMIVWTAQEFNMAGSENGIGTWNIIV